jgi:dienelactone hydrolase
MLDGFTSFEFDGPLIGDDHISHRVYLRGDGPPIIIWQELPGILPQTITLAEKMAEAGYTIYLPHLFGPLGKFAIARNLVRFLCIRREFHIFAAKKSSPVTNWMRALCHDVQGRHDGMQVGTLGMCLTGNFALTLMADDAVIGGVASQPSLPIFSQTALHMSDEEVTDAKAGMAAKGPVLSMRYTGDPLCKAAKMDALKDTFGDGVIIHNISGKGHALLTAHWSDEAYDKMMAYFDERFAKAA